MKRKTGGALFPYVRLTEFRKSSLMSDVWKMLKIGTCHMVGEGFEAF